MGIGRMANDQPVFAAASQPEKALCPASLPHVSCRPGSEVQKGPSGPATNHNVLQPDDR
jgi:hypothetical protein